MDRLHTIDGESAVGRYLNFGDALDAEEVSGGNELLAGIRRGPGCLRSESDNDQKEQRAHTRHCTIE
jgi:hypothetical protein